MKIHPYPARPLRLNVGDVIRCPKFEHGLRLADGDLLVAWSNPIHLQYHAAQGHGRLACDPSRATASFLVSSIALEHTDGPEDIAPGEHRLGRRVTARRLSDSGILLPDGERIVFDLDEPMSVIRPREEDIEIAGYVPFPLVWNEP